MNFSALSKYEMVKKGPATRGMKPLRQFRIGAIKKHEVGKKRWKCRNVVDGSMQQLSIQQSFAPVARNATIRMMLRLGAWLNAKVSSSDQRGAFLASDLPKDSRGEIEHV